MATAAAAASAVPVAGGVGLQKASASLVNSFRLAAVAQRLAFHVQAGPQRDNKEFVECCISFAKGIDYAIANSEVPGKAQEWPLLLKQVCQYRSDVSMRAAIMVLLISVKSACQLGWFPQKESQELLALADEIGNSFRNLGDTKPSLASPGSPFSQIMERFYPFFKLGHILASVEAKPGFAMLVTDFHISKRMPHAPHEKIRFFVAQTDNIESSACIINPPQVSFLLNGKGVEKRTTVLMDSGPQLPTVVTGMLKYGTNLLQAMGHFNGHYIIVVAFTDVTPPPDKPSLKDYVESGVVESNSDSDIIEGPSRISLNCPISRTRIKLPVKGHLCKHLQCFDFGNYVSINLRRPSWRCPHCNQPVCYTDIRVDQNMDKVLKEVGYNAADVIISADGSWKVVMENDENMDHMQETKHGHEDPSSFLNAGPVVLDLTADEDEMDTFGNAEVEDRKPHLSDLQHQSAEANSATPSNNANIAAPNEDFSSGFHLSDGLTPDSTIPNQFSAPSNTMPLRAQTLNTAIGQEYANLSQIPRTRDPVAIQALPVPFLQTSSPQDRPTIATTTFTASIPTAQCSQSQAPLVVPVGHGLGRTSCPPERWHPYSRASPHPPQAPATTSAQNFPATQSWNHSVKPPVSSLPLSQTLPGVAVSPQNRFVDGGQTAPQMGNQQRLNNPGGGPVQSVSRASDLVDLSSDANWRPQGRMRGSLVPGSYSPALDHLIIRPTLQSEIARPASLQPVQAPPAQLAQSAASYLLPQIQAFLANRPHPLNVPQMQTGSSPIGVPPGFAGPSQTMPPQNPGTQ